MNAIDTNVILYSLDHYETAKQRQAQQLLLQLKAAGEPTVLLWQVLGEAANQLRRWRDLGRLSTEEFNEHIRGLRHLFPLVIPTAESFEMAMNLSEMYSLSHWDSMILGACKEIGVTRLFTEDMGATREIEEIVLVNPFK